MTGMRVVLSVALLVTCSLGIEDADFWQRLGQAELRRRLNLRPNTNVAKNVILMVGDGLGLSTVMAARVLRGQLNNRTGEETVLNFESLPNLGLAKPYSVDNQVPDSAATATAMLSGIKTNSRVLNLDSTVTIGSCVPGLKAVPTMLHWSIGKGKHTGVVSTARVTHATPAAAYASSPHRSWETDYETRPPCKDIASQMIEDNKDIRVVLGGGRRMFIPDTTPDPVTGIDDMHKQRQDGRNLIQEWMSEKQNRSVSYKYVWNTKDFKQVDPKHTDFLLGLFTPSHMSYELERDQGPQGEPSLAEMTDKAIRMLQKNENGYFLLVEGGRIDHAHHATKAKKALHETLAFDDAVNVAMRLTNESDTLLIVTADHSHVMTVAGYPERGNDILGIVRPTEDNLGLDDQPYTTLSYANGPMVTNPRRNIASTDTTSNDFRQDALVPLDYETHSGEDVPVYSRGPMSHLLTGVMEQNVIAHVMAHAACVGNAGVDCDHGRPVTSPYTNNIPNKGESLISSCILFTTISLFVVFLTGFCE